MEFYTLKRAPDCVAAGRLGHRLCTSNGQPSTDHPRRATPADLQGVEKTVTADGNGPISAFVHGMRELGATGFTVEDYHEQAVGKGADARAMAYVPLKLDDGRTVYGVGTDTNIDQAAVRAIVAGLNRMAKDGERIDG